MNKTALKLYKWVRSIYDFKIGNSEIADSKAKEYAREKWFEYGERIIKKAINHQTCTSIRKFELLCDQYKELHDKTNQS